MYSEWAFTDVTGLLGLTLPPPDLHHIHEGLEPPGLEDALKAFLQATPPYPEFQAFTNNPNIVAYNDPGACPLDIDWTLGTVLVPPSPLPTGSLYTFLTGVSLGTTTATRPIVTT